MPLIGTLSSGNVLHATLSLPAPDTKYVISGIISGIKVNNGETTAPDENGLIHLWVVPEAFITDTELSSESTNVVTNKAITDYVKLTAEQKTALIALLND